jgi:hypothetical protein
MVAHTNSLPVVNHRGTRRRGGDRDARGARTEHPFLGYDGLRSKTIKKDKTRPSPPGRGPGGQERGASGSPFAARTDVGTGHNCGPPNVSRISSLGVDCGGQVFRNDFPTGSGTSASRN